MYAAVFPLLTARALDEPFEYLVPDSLGPRLRRGSLVAVPLSAGMVLGVVLGLNDDPVHAGRHVGIADLVDLPPVPGDLLDLAERVKDYYVTSLGSALGLVLPPGGGLRLERWADITPAGREALAGGQKGVEELRAFEGGAAPAPAARRPALERLRRRGWIAYAYRVRVTHEKGLRRLLERGPGEAKGLGARQRAAVELVERRAALDEATLRRRARLGLSGLNALLEREILVARGEVRRSAAPAASEAHRGETVPRLLPAQEEALAEITGCVGTGATILLHGVTGSGKTEVYLRAAEAVLRAGRGVLVLVPEIGLTGQTVARLADRFPGEPLSVLHSGLPAGERLTTWRDIAAGRSRLVIGARSAVFAPFPDLGLIVVDEEHDSSYKQDNEPRYDARTIARWRAQASGAVVVLGSATPSVEAFATVARHADLRERVDGSAPPTLEIVDMRDVSTLLSPQLAAALTTAVEAGEKVILFLNRRGYASLLACGHCGHGWECPNCDVPLALFDRGRRLRCRLCGHAAAAPAVCPECGSAELRRYGFGTEALEREVASLLPGVELLRLDSDVASSVARLRGVLDRFAAPGAKILVGTQMIAKGHHFPEVTLVGVVDADLTLRFPDFRAEERTFAMLVQVAGRSGRGERPGRVLVQTLDPEARPIAAAASGEHEPFYADEIERRAALSYPPAGVLIGVEVSSPDASKAAAGADFVRDKLAAAVPAGDLVLGPGPLGRERSRHVARLVVKTQDAGKTVPAVRALLDRYGARFAARGARIVVDVEPQWL